MDIIQQIEEINYSIKEADSLYQKIAKNYGLSYCAFWILYILYNDNQVYYQQDLQRKLFFPKQTINSTISKLKKEGLLILQTIEETKNKKNIYLTEKGKKLTKKYVGIIKEMEYNSFSNFTKKEREVYIELSKKHIKLLKNEYNNIFEKEVNNE